jgi:predicted 3-demethylubiquinone-9 3-methyltransferase (glyoxalase superfamily)
MQKIRPCLWFDGTAEEAARYYTSIFKRSKILLVNKVITIFEIDGQEIMALNGGPQFHFSEALSLMVNCDTQGELDELWEKLSAGGSKGDCGWLKDKYGLSWQIVPAVLPKLMDTPQKFERVMEVVMQMNKLDIAAMQRAADQA